MSQLEQYLQKCLYNLLSVYLSVLSSLSSFQLLLPVFAFLKYPRWQRLLFCLLYLGDKSSVLSLPPDSLVSTQNVSLIRHSQYFTIYTVRPSLSPLLSTSEMSNRRGQQLHCYYWTNPHLRTKCLVLLSHGFSEHLGMYNELAEILGRPVSHQGRAGTDSLCGSW